MTENITQNNSKRIAKNTLLLYIRTFITMAISLYTSRVILEVLGINDFGIYNVVGGFVGMFALISATLTSSTQRFITYELGKKDENHSQEIFSTAVLIHIIIALVIIVLAESVGVYFLNNQMNIPISRLTAANWVFQFSLITFVVNIISIPYNSTIIAHERMAAFAYITLIESILKLLIVYLLILSTFDKLIIYGALMLLVSLAIRIIYGVYCSKNFIECKFKLVKERFYYKQILGFSGWNIIGSSSVVLTNYGINILLNIFFGPAVNAARAVSVQVSAVVTRFTENMMTAVKPQIIKSYASGDCEYMVTLIEKSSKYAYFLAALIAIPVMVEIEFILEVWLGEVPSHTISFTRLVLCESLIGVFIPPLWMAANATGHIKNSQVYGRMFTLAILPISYLLLRLNANPLVPFIVAVLANVGYWFYSLCDIHRQIQLNMRKYFRDVVRPILIFTFSLVLVGSILMLIEPNDSVFRFLIVFSLSVFIGFSVIYSLLQSSERMILHAALKRFVVK